jgi:hypothetical protein
MPQLSLFLRLYRREWFIQRTPWRRWLTDTCNQITVTGSLSSATMGSSGARGS